jgi:hypothetical protein
MSDYWAFARYIGVETPSLAVSALVALSPGMANRLAIGFRIHMADAGLAPGTVARRLVAIRMAVRAARRLGLITWELDVPGPKPECYRDTTGPGLAGWKAMLATATQEGLDPTVTLVANSRRRPISRSPGKMGSRVKEKPANG